MKTLTEFLTESDGTHRSGVTSGPKADYRLSKDGVVVGRIKTVRGVTTMVAGPRTWVLQWQAKSNPYAAPQIFLTQDEAEAFLLGLS